MATRTLIVRAARASIAACGRRSQSAYPAATEIAQAAPCATSSSTATAPRMPTDGSVVVSSAEKLNGTQTPRMPASSAIQNKAVVHTDLYRRSRTADPPSPRGSGGQATDNGTYNQQDESGRDRGLW